MLPSDNQKNLLIAIILSIAVLLGWQMLYGTPQPQRGQDGRPAPTQTTPSHGITAPEGETPAAPGAAAPGRSQARSISRFNSSFAQRSGAGEVRPPEPRAARPEDTLRRDGGGSRGDWLHTARNRPAFGR